MTSMYYIFIIYVVYVALQFTLHFSGSTILCSQCYAAQHSYVPLLSIRRDSPSKIVPDFLCATL